MFPRVHEYAEASLNRFRDEWAKYMRGEVPVKNDIDVTQNDTESKNLILFGDPGSNKWISHQVPRLDLRWSEKGIEFGGKIFDAKTHVPLMILPKFLPYAPAQYVVFNSGHTFHAEDFKGTNALLYPRLGDYAVLKLEDKGGPLAHRVVLNGLFDEQWKVYPGK
jgi:hypothetical protein